MYNFDRALNLAFDYFENNFRKAITKLKADKFVFVVYPEKNKNRIVTQHVITNGISSVISFNDNSMQDFKAVNALSALKGLNNSETVKLTITPSMPNPVKLELGDDVVFAKSLKAAYKIHKLDVSE